MAAEPEFDPPDPKSEPVQAGAVNFWTRVKEHKIIQWGLAYLGGALALAQGEEFVAGALDWPDSIARVVVIALIVGLPIALTLAWYHGHRGLTRISAGELTIIGVLLLLGALFFTVAIRPPADRAVAATSPDPEPARAATVAKREVLQSSVAVLPLENLGGPENDLYAEAMHGEIINKLTRLRNLTVINRESVTSYAPAGRPPLRQIAEVLRVQSLLVGTVQYVAGRFRVNVELVDPESNVNLWSDQYEGDLAELLTAQADIAMNVANHLRTQFSAEEQARIERVPTDSPLAAELYLQAAYLIGVGNQAPRIQELLDKAIEADPKFAAAYGYKAGLYATQLINTTVGSARSREVLEPLIEQNVEAALSLDPDSVAALGARANLAVLSWRWAEARDAGERIYAITGSSEYNATWFWSWSGNQAEAQRRAAREVEINPRSWAAHFTRGLVQTYAKDYAAAVDAFHRAIDVSPILQTRSSLAIAEAARGDVEGARRELRLAEEALGPNRTIIVLLDMAYAYGRIGDRETARKLVAEIDQAVLAGQEIGAGGRAFLHLAVGEYDEALKWLRQGAEKAERHEIDAGFYQLMNLKLNYAADPMLERPDFVDVRDRLVGD